MDQGVGKHCGIGIDFQQIGLKVVAHENIKAQQFIGSSLLDQFTVGCSINSHHDLFDLMPEFLSRLSSYLLHDQIPSSNGALLLLLV